MRRGLQLNRQAWQLGQGSATAPEPRAQDFADLAQCYPVAGLDEVDDRTIIAAFGTVAGQRKRAPVVFYLLTGLAGVIIFLDAALFYFGLASQTASGWSAAPAYVVPAATVLYTAGLALVGAWHADYHTSNTV
jgi:hypothetical protein